MKRLCVFKTNSPDKTTHCINCFEFPVDRIAFWWTAPNTNLNTQELATRHHQSSFDFTLAFKRASSNPSLQRCPQCFAQSVNHLRIYVYTCIHTFQPFWQSRDTFSRLCICHSMCQEIEPVMILPLRIRFTDLHRVSAI